MNDLVTFSGRKASQNKYELEAFRDFLKAKNVTKYMEIGARHGDSFHFLMSALPVGSIGVAVDLPGALWGNLSSRDALRDAVNDLNAKGYFCQYVFLDSQKPETRKQVMDIAQFDAILIDGDHTLAGVLKDWNNYKDLAKYVAFHDIVGTGQYEKVFKNPVEVPLLWEELKKDYETIEFIDTHSKMGIGVVCTSP